MPTPSDIATPADAEDFRRDIASLRGKLTTDFSVSIRDAGPLRHDPEAMTEHEICVGRKVIASIWHPRAGKVSTLLAKAALKMDSIERQAARGCPLAIDV
jgi:hypothetical protein